MRSVPEHQQVVADLIRPVAHMGPAPVRVCAGRVLGVDVVAPIPLPVFANSAMDGYAVRAADIAGAPVTLEVSLDIPAGRTDVPPLPPGTAARIMTGAPIPAGADTIVQVELTDAGLERVAISEARSIGTHVRPEGEDVERGEVVIPAGTVLRATHLGLLAALGLEKVPVHGPVNVLVVSTGTELVEPGSPLLPGQIYESNATMLVAALQEAGAAAMRTHIVADDVSAFHAALAADLGKVDLVLTSGGVSAGAYEVVKDALTGQGVEFTKVAMQPGMPQGAGRYEGVPVVTLPGNPVSSMVSFEVFVRPAIRAAMGFPDPARPVVRAVLTESLTAPAGKRQFRRGLLETTLHGATVKALGPPASHHLRWLAASNALLDIPVDVTALAAGDEVDVWPTS